MIACTLSVPLCLHCYSARPSQMGNTYTHTHANAHYTRNACNLHVVNAWAVKGLERPNKPFAIASKRRFRLKRRSDDVSVFFKCWLVVARGAVKMHASQGKPVGRTCRKCPKNYWPTDTNTHTQVHGDQHLHALWLHGVLHSCTNTLIRLITEQQQHNYQHGADSMKYEALVVYTIPCSIVTYDPHFSWLAKTITLCYS